MPIDTTWTAPSSLARGSGQTYPYAYYEDLVSDVNVLGGSDGNSKTGPYYIDQATADTDILRLLSTGDVTQPYTDYTVTNAFGSIRKISGTAGGLEFAGLAESSASIGLYGFGAAGTDDTTKATTSTAYVIWDGRKHSGTGVTNPGAGANIFIARSNSVTKFIVDQEGDLHVDGSTSLTAFDAYDDALLVRAAARELTPVGLIRDAYDEFVRYGRHDLEAAGLVRFNDGPNGDGVPFVNVTGFVRLLCGSQWQSYKRLMQLEDKLAFVTERLLDARP